MVTLFRIIVFIFILALQYEIERLIDLTTSVERRVRRLEIEHGINPHEEDRP